jgi:hypothetical protein
MVDLPMIGLFHNCATVLATTATLANGAPIPGPFNKKKYGTFLNFLNI